MESILTEIRNEREYQKKKWGTDADDQVNTPMDFVGYIANHSTRWFPGGFRPYNDDTLYDFRDQMIKTAALAVAAIEYTDKLLDGSNIRPDVKTNQYPDKPLFDQETIG